MSAASINDSSHLFRAAPIANLWYIASMKLISLALLLRPDGRNK
jgi:hypothetical protein